MTREVFVQRLYKQINTQYCPWQLLNNHDLNGFIFNPFCFFSDVAIAAPYGGQFHRGLVYIHNGRPTGLNPVASQVLEGTWASASMPSSFGYAMNGGTDVDQNGYPG